MSHSRSEVTLLKLSKTGIQSLNYQFATFNIGLVIYYKITANGVAQARRQEMKWGGGVL